MQKGHRVIGPNQEHKATIIAVLRDAQSDKETEKTTNQDTYRAQQNRTEEKSINRMYIKGRGEGVKKHKHKP